MARTTDRKRRQFGWAAVALAGIVFAIGGGAFADTILVDGDVVANPTVINIGGTGNRPCTDLGKSIAGAATIKYNGSTHFTAGETVDAVVTPQADATAAGITATPGTGSVPSPWTSSSPDFSIGFSTFIPADVADGAYHVEIGAIGETSSYDPAGRPQFIVNISCATSGSTNHAPAVSVANASVEVNEGSAAANSGTYSDADGDPVTLTASYGTVTKDANGPGTWSWSAAPDDGPSDSQTVTITATDSHSATGTGSFSLVVDNVAPSMGSITGPTNVLAGSSYSYTYSVSATDPSNADTTAGFYWAWDPGTGTFGAYTSSKSSSPNQSPAISFSSCGSSTVRAKAKDKDLGEASPASLTVAAYDGQFLPPLTAGIYNAVQKGQVVPVKISIGCNGTFLTGLTPLINLKSGDQDPLTDPNDPTANVATSVSAADTSGQMRPIDGGYIYNLGVPSNATAGTLFTIYVRPFGGTAPVMMVVLKIRK